MVNIATFPPVSGGGDADVSYIRSTPMGITVGGATSGTKFNGTLAQALDKILYPYLAPTFSAFSSNMPTVLEVGDTIAAGEKIFTWSTTNSANIVANTVNVKDTTNALDLALLIANDGTEPITITAVTKNTATNNIWTISAKSVTDATFSRNLTSNWYWGVYYGESALGTLTEIDVKALRVKELRANPNKTYAMKAGSYKWICYPVAMGLKTVFKDVDTNFDVAMNPVEVVSITNDFGITTDYYCHRTFNVLGGSINIGVS